MAATATAARSGSGQAQKPGRQAGSPKAGSPESRLRAVPPAKGYRRSVGDVITLLAFCLFLGLMILAGLHAFLVQNQARLDDLIAENQDRQERIEQLLAEIAYLDSPEGVAEQAASVGLVPAAEIITLVPLASGALPGPEADPFSLAGLPPIAEVELSAQPAPAALEAGEVPG